MVCLIGRNGVGKIILLKILMGLIKLWKGIIKLWGKGIVKLIMD